MQRLLLALATGLLAFVGSAWADGPVVRWGEIVGLSGHEDSAGLVVAGIQPTVRWVVVADGKAMLDLQTGFLSIDLIGASSARHIPYPGAGAIALGAPLPQQNLRKGAIVCNSTERYGSPEVVSTAAFALDQGSAKYRGFISVPESCVAHPDDIVFLLLTDTGGSTGTYFAYGAARTIQ